MEHLETKHKLLLAGLHAKQASFQAALEERHRHDMESLRMRMRLKRKMTAFSYKLKRINRYNNQRALAELKRKSL